MLPSASHHLPCVGLFEPKGRIVERLAKDISGPFSRRQPLQQPQKSRLQALGVFDSQRRIDAHVDRFGLTGIGLTLPARAS